jgi:hypothetical protein
MARIAHRASFLQAFHTATSETARKAWIDSPEFEAAKADLPEFLDEGPNAIDGTTSLPEDNRVRNLKAGQTVGRGVVRKITPAQAGFILKLINERDLTGLNILPGQTINPKEIPTMGVKGGSALIEKLLNCPIKSRPITSNDSGKKEISGSPKQLTFITSLLSERILSESDITNMFVRTQYKASAIISELLAMPKAKETKEELSQGIYTDGAKTYKAYISQDGSKLLCKELIEESHTESVKVNKTEKATVRFTHDWEYRGMAFRFIKLSTFRKVSDDEAKKYGQISGTCCRCGRRLVDETSVGNGIGPECAKK